MATEIPSESMRYSHDIPTRNQATLTLRESLISCDILISPRHRVTNVCSVMIYDDNSVKNRNQEYTYKGGNGYARLANVLQKTLRCTNRPNLYEAIIDPLYFHRASQSLK